MLYYSLYLNKHEFFFISNRCKPNMSGGKGGTFVVGPGCGLATPLPSHNIFFQRDQCFSFIDLLKHCWTVTRRAGLTM